MDARTPRYTNKEVTMINYIYEDDIGCVELIDHMGNDKSAVNAARVSFLRDTKDQSLTARDKKLIKLPS